jgi:FAD/FMN-containing dehydrogenase
MARETSRQAFVRGALGAAAGALVGSCRSPATPAPPAAPSPQTPSAVQPQRWKSLDDAIDGTVVLPSNAEYGSAKAVFNTRFDDSRPVAVVMAKSTDDVKKAVAFAADNDTTIAVRSGGHSYIGASTANGGMVIDLRQLPEEVSIDDGFATISDAAELDSVQTALAETRRSIPSGSCPSVGIGGLTLGGGLGSDARSAGLTCDALTSATVVLPSGDKVTATPDDHADLFWALRGGGGGNFGVVTSLTFRTFPTSDRDVVTLAFPEDATAEVVAGWYAWLRAADRAIWGMVNIRVGSGPGSCLVVLATPPGDGPSRATDLSAAIGVKPSSNTSRTLNRVDFVHYFEGGPDATKPRAFVAGSDIIDGMTEAAATAIVAATSAWPQEAGAAATTVIESLSGAVADAAPGDTAFPWRRQATCVQWYTETRSAVSVDSANQWLTSAHQAVQANSAGAYVNYIEPDTPAARYFGENLARLAAIRGRYDPNRLMRSGLIY